MEFYFNIFSSVLAFSWYVFFLMLMVQLADAV